MFPVRLLVKNRFLLLLALLPCTSLIAEVTLPKILASHMVVQRDCRYTHGAGNAGETVSVSFRGETRSTVVGQLGRWSLYLKPGAAGGPFQMVVNGTLSAAPDAAPSPAEPPITLDDVLVGDVWVASGQSNMEFEMRKAATARRICPMHRMRAFGC